MKNKIKKILSQGFDDLQEGKTFYENTVPKIEELIKERDEEVMKSHRETFEKGYIKGVLDSEHGLTSSEEILNEK